MGSLSEQLTLFSKLWFAIWRGLKLKRDFTGRLAGGARINLRAPPAPDVAQAEQVFGGKIFEPPQPLPASPRMVDASAGCGLAVLYWLERFPNAVFIAFEAHPNLVDAFVENAELNAAWDRVLLHPSEAGVEEGQAKLEGDEGFASIFKKGGASRYQNAKRVDFFKMVGDAPIALLKLKASSGEHPILADARFAGLKVGQMVIEGLTAGSRGWCEKRLAELGYRTGPGGGEGLLWATPAAVASAAAS